MHMFEQEIINDGIMTMKNHFLSRNSFLTKKTTIIRNCIVRRVIALQRTKVGNFEPVLIVVTQTTTTTIA